MCMRDHILQNTKIKQNAKKRSKKSTKYENEKKMEKKSKKNGKNSKRNSIIFYFFAKNIAHSAYSR